MVLFLQYLLVTEDAKAVLAGCIVSGVRHPNGQQSTRELIHLAHLTVWSAHNICVQPKAVRLVIASKDPGNKIHLNGLRRGMLYTQPHFRCQASIIKYK